MILRYVIVGVRLSWWMPVEACLNPTIHVIDWISRIILFDSVSCTGVALLVRAANFSGRSLMRRIVLINAYLISRKRIIHWYRISTVPDA